MERRAVAVTGIVQGVGFRPHVYRLASRLDLGGFVRNQSSGVWIEVEGEPHALEIFLSELETTAPPLARIHAVSWEPRPTRGERAFRIESSDVDVDARVFVSPDAATCPDCLRELFDPEDRRFRYSFLNCTHCGPRLTIVTGAPYDRERTTMAGFALCAACRREYEDPEDRRFHAQPIACPRCGPSLSVRDREGRPVEAEDPLAPFVEALRSGAIGAVKGLGGFHLCCDGRREDVVVTLRRRKHRDEKPFALMVKDIQAAESLCEVGAEEKELLLSPQRPIVLLRRREDSALPSGIAPANPRLGVMLPYTPLHHLLLDGFDAPLIMTSGNLSDDPIAYEDEDAVRRLSGIADLYLTHNRPIRVRCEDSVTRVVGGAELPVRRSRGYAPQPLTLPLDCPRPTLALGGQLKVTFALARGRHAFLSHHVGDLDHYDAFRAYVRDIELYERLFEIEPELLVHDLHPDYASTRFALEQDLPRLAVQHHHAHMASVMAENALTEKVIGVTFDGTGYGTDGAVWGGEFLIGDYLSFERVAHFKYVAMPGGERAIKEPVRMAVAYLDAAGCDLGLVRARVPEGTIETWRRMIERGLNAPPTSSAGRLFDAVAALLGVRDRVSYEGQAAMELEWLATTAPPDGFYAFEVRAVDGTLEIDTLPLIVAVAREAKDGAPPAWIARRFHSTVVEIIASVGARLRESFGLNRVVLSGGCFQNALLLEEGIARLTGEGFSVYRHRVVPPNDGGLSLGQIAVAAAQCRK